jgi:hypothetical protein
MPSYLPTRVVDVGTSDEMHPKLYIPTPNEEARYLALSYCWGGDQEVKATVAGLPELLQIIRPDRLGQSLKDAITVARRLGIRFLWIDALCIVQDDPNDVAKEIAKMPKIYQGAYCTIAAATAASHRDGFLAHRTVSSRRKHAQRIPYICPDGQLGNVYFFKKEQHHHEEEPLHSRGWTLQERLISPRVLAFGSWQMQWSCRTENACDGGPWSSSMSHLEWMSSNLLPSSFYSKKRRDRWREKLHSNTKFEHYSYRPAVNLWRKMVREFTNRKLTVAADRPLAIAGLAEVYGAILNEKYLAGLWENTFLHDLLWTRQTSTPLKSRRVPSWSWTSVDGPIDWVVEREEDLKGCQTSLLTYKLQLEYESAPFGVLESGVITMQGRILKAAIYTGPRSTTFLHICPSDNDTWEPSTATAAHAIWDDESDIPTPGSAPSPLWCFEVLPYAKLDQYDGSPYGRPQGLILSKNSGTDVFCRVGYFNFDEPRNDEDLKTYQERWKIRDQDRKTRDHFRKHVFKECPLSEIIIE